jgi:hypothetical protein
MSLLLALLAQSSAASFAGIAQRIAEHPVLARRFEIRSAQFVRCGRQAIERNIAVQATGMVIEQMSQDQAAEVFQSSIAGAAKDCEIDHYATAVAADIRAVLPDVDQATAVSIARANLLQLIGLSVWGSEP